MGKDHAWIEECRKWALDNARENLKTRCNDHCERCDKELNDQGVIHHIFYQKDINSALLVCKSCHVAIHKLHDEKDFLKKVIKHLRFYYEGDPVGDVINNDLKRLEELKLDKDLPAADDFEKYINTDDNTIINKRD